VDTADQRLLTQAPAYVARLSLTQSKARKRPARRPEINRQDRVIFTAYLVMVALIVAFLVVAGLVAWLGA
jgi:CHASE3 domain sensor protein